MQEMLSLDLTGWQEVEPHTWQNSDGDGLSVHSFDIPPDIPAPLEQLDVLRQRLAVQVARAGAGLVEADVSTIDGLPALRQIVKVPMQPSGMAYLGTFTIPRSSASWVLKVQCLERGATGVRDAMVLDRYIAGHPGRSVEELMGSWAQPPYAPGLTGGAPRNRSEDQEWDEHFPLHPLSRARRLQRAVHATLRVHSDVRTMPPFRGRAELRRVGRLQ